jgi:hypothetical protein
MTEDARGDPGADTCRAEAVLGGRFAALFGALTAVGLWPAPVAEDVWWVQWSYQWVHLWVLDPEDGVFCMTPEKVYFSNTSPEWP